jgi:hypothetical protein
VAVDLARIGPRLPADAPPFGRRSSIRRLLRRLTRFLRRSHRARVAALDAMFARRKRSVRRDRAECSPLLRPRDRIGSDSLIGENGLLKFFNCVTARVRNDVSHSPPVLM